MRLVKDFGKNTVADGMVGFQHCPLFCSNNDKALCNNCFDVPTDLQVGSTYTFVWEWSFNSLSDMYSSCWEAQIVASNNVPSTTGTNNVPSTTGVHTTQVSTTQAQQMTTGNGCQTTASNSQQTTASNSQQTTAQSSGCSCDRDPVVQVQRMGNNQFAVLLDFN